MQDGLFGAFEEVRLFGSTLHSNCPMDIDLLLVYKGSLSPDILTSCDEVNIAVYQQFGVDVHLTVLSESERDQTGFVGLVDTMQIK